MSGFTIGDSYFTVSLFGHRQLDISRALEDRLEKAIRSLLLEKEYVEFLIGRDGEFDIWAASVIKRLKRTVRDDNSSLTWVMPYMEAEYKNSEESMGKYYDHIEICDAATMVHFKRAYAVRNRRMVDRSDLVIAYVNHQKGGAYQAIDYAEKTGKKVINLANEDQQYE